VESIGLRELRQNASELVRRAERGEVIVVTVSGRPVAQLGPLARGRWRRIEDVAEIFDGPADPTWTQDRELLPDPIEDPWER
jgi:prevent-host-death family protein